NRNEDLNSIFQVDRVTLSSSNLLFQHFQKRRKVVIATNIAETSITIPDVRVVIDSGKVKQKNYTAGSHYSTLKVKNTSKAQAIQRAGRAGRCEAGKCYRLYSKETYEKFADQTTPEILRSRLSEVVFSLLAARITSLGGISLLSQPKDDEWA